MESIREIMRTGSNPSLIATLLKLQLREQLEDINELRRYQGKDNDKKRGRKSKKPPIEILQALYYNDAIKAEDLAKTYNVKPQTIYNWIWQAKKNQNIV